MAGFHPAAGKVMHCEIGDKKRHHRVSSISNNNSSSTTTTTTTTNNNNNNNHDEDDIVESDSNSSDYDQPYHETALDWYNRHVRQRSRRRAGISSCSSSECGSISSSDSEDDDDFFDVNDNGGNDEDTANRKRRKEMAQAVRSAERPLKKWLASYPIVAAQSCLSSTPIAIALDKSTAAADASHFGRVPRTSALPLPPRVEESKRLRTILRRLRRKRNEFRDKFRCSGNAAVPSVLSEVTYNGGGSCNQTSNEPSLELTTRINHDGAETPENDEYAIHSFLPQGTGISFIDAALARESLLQSKLSRSDSGKKQQQKTLSRLVLELVRRSTVFFSWRLLIPLMSLKKKS